MNNNNNDKPTAGSVVSAMFLVAGTCIGGGMLALPVATGIGGFLPSLAVLLIGWLAMTATALLLLEVSLWMEEGAHIITMTSRLLGMPGKAVSWCLYLFICYASLVAYTAGGGHQISSALSAYLDWPFSKELGCVLFIVAFGVIVDLGSYLVGRINAILFIAMIAAYFALVVMGIDEVNLHLLTHQRWSYSIWSVPLILTTFSFQTMVPSLTPYLKRHVKSLRIAVIGGTAITLCVYILWQWLILGIVPVEGTNGLLAALQLGEPPTQFLREHVNGRWVSVIAEYFAFFAIVTSFLGIALGLVDFLSDGLKIRNKGWGKIALGALIIIPTLIFATQYERAFLVAMEATGGIGDSILNGLIPVMMVWIGRYHRGFISSMRLPGGKPVLALIFVCFFTAFIIQLLAYTVQPLEIYNAREIMDNP